MNTKKLCITLFFAVSFASLAPRSIVLLLAYENTGKLAKHKRDIRENQEKKFRDAAQKGDLKTVKKLISLVNSNAQDKQGHTALSLASAHGHYDIVKVLLDSPTIDVNVQDALGNTALMAAVLFSTSKMVELMLTAPHRDLTRKDAQGRTAFMLAAELSSHNPDDSDDARKVTLIRRAA